MLYGGRAQCVPQTMATIKQTAANRANSQKSTGPRSPEGKVRSSKNALKSGIDAEDWTPPWEEADALDALREEYHHHYNPASPAARALVDNLIHGEWLMRRYAQIEAQLFAFHAETFIRPNPDCPMGQAFN